MSSAKKTKGAAGKHQKVSLKQIKKEQKQARKEAKTQASASEVAELCAALEGVRVQEEARPEQRLTKRQQRR